MCPRCVHAIHLRIRRHVDRPLLYQSSHALRALSYPLFTSRHPKDACDMCVKEKDKIRVLYPEDDVVAAKRTVEGFRMCYQKYLNIHSKCPRERYQSGIPEDENEIDEEGAYQNRRGKTNRACFECIMESESNLLASHFLIYVRSLEVFPLTMC